MCHLTISQATCSTNVYPAAFYLYLLQSTGWVLNSSSDDHEELEDFAAKTLGLKRAQYMISEFNYVELRGDKTVRNPFLR